MKLGRARRLNARFLATSGSNWTQISRITQILLITFSDKVIKQLSIILRGYHLKFVYMLQAELLLFNLCNPCLKRILFFQPFPVGFVSTPVFGEDYKSASNMLTMFIEDLYPYLSGIQRLDVSLRSLWSQVTEGSGREIKRYQVN